MPTAWRVSRGQVQPRARTLGSGLWGVLLPFFVKNILHRKIYPPGEARLGCVTPTAGLEARPPVRSSPFIWAPHTPPLTHPWTDVKMA